MIFPFSAENVKPPKVKNIFFWPKDKRKVRSNSFSAENEKFPKSAQFLMLRLLCRNIIPISDSATATS